MTVQIWESVTWSLENSSYCYVDAITGRRVDQKTKRFLQDLSEYTSDDAEVMEAVANRALEQGLVKKATVTKASKATLLDASTANIMNQVFNAVNDQNKANLRNRPFVQAANICWKLASK